MRKHQQTGSSRQGDTAIEQVRTILAKFRIVVVDITSDYRTPETVYESDGENQAADKGRIQFQNCSQVNHQVASYRLENQILRQVARAEADALEP